MRCALDRYDVVVNMMHEIAHLVVLPAQGHICFCVIETPSGVLVGHLFAKCSSDGVLGSYPYRSTFRRSVILLTAQRTCGTDIEWVLYSLCVGRRIWRGNERQVCIHN